jgi:hypothetical protein
MKTGKTVDEPGLYSTECCSTERIFAAGDTLWRCPQCQRLCEWEFECELWPSGDLDRIDEMVA